MLEEEIADRDILIEHAFKFNDSFCYVWPAAAAGSMFLLNYRRPRLLVIAITRPPLSSSSLYHCALKYYSYKKK